MRGLYYSKVIYPERVVFWARVFDWVLAAPALFWGAFALVDSLRPEKERDEHMMLAVIVAIIGLLFPLAPALALGPGRRWAYYYQMLTLTIGSLLGGCSFGPLIVLLWVPAGILLYYLNRPEVRRYCEDGL